jgi:hypothetical protein
MIVTTDDDDEDKDGEDEVREELAGESVCPGKCARLMSA